MTINRDILTDREETKRLLSNLAARVGCDDVEPNWLGHTGGAARIDYELLDGVTMDRLLRHRATKQAVNRHLAHLKEHHGLLVTRDGKIRFNRTELGLQESVPSPDGGMSTDLAEVAVAATKEGYFSPATIQDERERRLREVVQRRGQPEFRTKLIKAYGGMCALTGCDAVVALEAAHITPYCGLLSSHLTNGLLLRADIHTLFDLDLIGIHPKSRRVHLNPLLKKTSYKKLHGVKLLEPANAADRPNTEALEKRWEQFKNR